jgi:hypothetical protein
MLPEHHCKLSQPAKGGPLQSDLEFVLGKLDSKIEVHARGLRILLVGCLLSRFLEHVGADTVFAYAQTPPENR